MGFFAHGVMPAILCCALITIRYYGGWAAPNIYFLGFSGVVKFGNIRIGGLSGIHKQHNYHSGHYERPPYNEQTIRSVYHVRHYDVLKLMHLKEPLDIFLSHDWPLGITEYGNWQKLIHAKKHFEEEHICIAGSRLSSNMERMDLQRSFLPLISAFLAGIFCRL